MFSYYNANPFKRNVNDCSVRAIALATNRTWDQTYNLLADYAREQGITFSETEFIDEFLSNRFDRFYSEKKIYTLQDFLELKVQGVYLVTMNGHITCVIDGVIYDTFDCSDRTIWSIYKVSK